MSRLNIKPAHKPVHAFYSLSASNGERAGERCRSAPPVWHAPSASTSLLRIRWGAGGRRSDELSWESGKRAGEKCRRNALTRRSINPNLDDLGVGHESALKSSFRCLSASNGEKAG